MCGSFCGIVESVGAVSSCSGGRSCCCAGCGRGGGGCGV